MQNNFLVDLPSNSVDLDLTHFDYELPEALIAQMPSSDRASSRLLLVKPEGFESKIFSDLLTQLHEGDVLVMNDTKVIKARLFGVKNSGGKVEVMLDRVTSSTSCIAQIRASKALIAGGQFAIHDAQGKEVFSFIVESKNDRFYHLTSSQPLLPMLELYGVLPLPPYINHAADNFDANRYQTVFAKIEGAVAAPTAGLHFDADLLSKIEAKGIKLAYVTLHVGAGTFLPVSTNKLEQHVMHQEWYEISELTAQTINQARALGKRIVAVGTTSLRALESAAVAQNIVNEPNRQLQAISAETRLFIRPPYQFGLVDALVTNFHLPQSTLLMLVSAFSGLQTIRDAYNYAISQSYHFFSYGDAMFLTHQEYK